MRQVEQGVLKAVAAADLVNSAGSGDSARKAEDPRQLQATVQTTTLRSFVCHKTVCRWRGSVTVKNCRTPRFLTGSAGLA